MIGATLAPNQVNYGEQLVYPTSEEMAGVLDGLTFDHAGVILDGLSVALLNPLAENRFHNTRPTVYSDEMHAYKMLSPLVGSIDSFMTYPSATEDVYSEIDLLSRWEIIQSRWPSSTASSGAAMHEIIVLNNMGRNVSRRTAGLVNIIMDDGMPVVAWDPVDGAGAEMLADIPVLHRKPRLLAAYVMLFDEHRQERGEE